MISDDKFDFWIKNNLNVLFIGKHGVGKTAQITNAFKRNNLDFMYFSAATMDPWVDFIGVPKETTGEDGIRYLDLVRPKAFTYDTVEAIFLDELNRAPGKVRNAVMELIQFRSINGKKFNNLKMIWGAINPEDDEKTYDVERLDPAQKDRFPVHIYLDYAPDLKFFTQKYGPDRAKSAIEWWNSLGTKVQELVSPRRLDYALEMYDLGGVLQDVLPRESNASKLQSLLSNGLAKDKIERMLRNNDLPSIEKELRKPNVYDEVKDWLIETPERTAKLVPLLDEELMAQLFTKHYKNTKFFQAFFSRFHDSPKVENVVRSLNHASQDRSYRELIYNAIPALSSTNFGTSPTEWKPSVKDDTSAIKRLLTYGSEDSKNLASRPEVLTDLQLVPQVLSANDATVIINICKSVIRGVVANPESNWLGENYESVIGPMNYCMKNNNFDIRASDQFKTVCNYLIKHKLERFVWIPSTK